MSRAKACSPALPRSSSRERPTQSRAPRAMQVRGGDGVEAVVQEGPGELLRHGAIAAGERPHVELQERPRRTASAARPLRSNSRQRSGCASRGTTPWCGCGRGCPAGPAPAPCTATPPARSGRAPASAQPVCRGPAGRRRPARSPRCAPASGGCARAPARRRAPRGGRPRPRRRRTRDARGGWGRRWRSRGPPARAPSPARPPASGRRHPPRAAGGSAGRRSRSSVSALPVARPGWLREAGSSSSCSSRLAVGDAVLLAQPAAQVHGAAARGAERECGVLPSRGNGLSDRWGHGSVLMGNVS